MWPEDRKERLFKDMKYAGVAQLVEHQPSKLRVEGSSLFARSVLPLEAVTADVAQG